MPVRHVLVRDARGHVEHDDRALPLDAAGGGGRSQAVSCVCVAATTLLVLWFEVARLVLVSVTKAAKLLLRAGEATTGVPTASKKRRLSAAEAIRCREHLPCSIPHVEDELSAVGVELERVDLHAKGGWQQARAAVRSVRGAGVKGAS